MAVDISQYLDAIIGNTDGEEVIQAIHDACLALGTDMYKTADISELLENIKNNVFGKDIRESIYEILKRLSEAEPSGGGGTNTIHGTFILDFGGLMVSPAVLCGTMTEEE